MRGWFVGSIGMFGVGKKDGHVNETRRHVDVVVVWGFVIRMIFMAGNAQAPNIYKKKIIK